MIGGVAGLLAAMRSSAFKMVLYDELTGELHVIFTDGTEETYECSTLEVIAMATAPSPGRYFNAHIRK